MAIADRMVFGKEIIEIAKDRKDFVVCSADTKTCALETFGALFPDREFNFGIAEQNLVSAAAGLASCGNKVILATFAVFASMRACEQVRTFICYPNLDVTIIGTHTGLQVGSDGATHMALEDVSIMRSFPNMTIIQPSDAVSAKKLAHLAVDFKCPLYVRLHRNPVPDIHLESDEIEIGKALIIREGADVTFIVSGILLGRVLKAAQELEAIGISARILEMHTIKPLDENAVLKAARETGAIVTVEDHTIVGGLGSAVAEVLSEQFPSLMKRIGVRDVFGESGDPDLLYRDYHMDVSDMVEAAKVLVEIRRKSGERE